MKAAGDNLGGPIFSSDRIAGFIKHLNNSASREGSSLKLSGLVVTGGEYPTIRSVWEACDLSAGEFADQVAAHCGCPRMSMAELLAAPSITERFSRRFLRETMAFPFDAGEGRFVFAVTGPSGFALPFTMIFEYHLPTSATVT